MLGHLPGKFEFGHHCIIRLDFGDDFQLFGIEGQLVRILEQQAAADAFDIHPPPLSQPLNSGHLHDAHVFLLGEHLQRRRLVTGSDDDLDEVFDDLLRRGSRHRRIESQNPAEGGHRIGLPRLNEDFGLVLSDGGAAGIGVLDDHRRGV